LSIDDFGAGYSSLTYLKRFPVDRLKIDRSFLSEHSDDATIVRAVISLGHSLGLRVVAEGVETVEQSRFLQASGCDEAQGFYYSVPVEPERFAELLLDSASSTSVAARRSPHVPHPPGTNGGRVIDRCEETAENASGLQGLSCRR
jgi:EAL domain-containing protein (putative c-di-GMP-specific phosphodiesterase class I)